MKVSLKNQTHTSALCGRGNTELRGPPQHGWDFPITLVSMGLPGKLWIYSHFCFQCFVFFFFGCFKIQKHTRSSPLVWDSPEDEKRASQDPLIMKPQQTEGHFRDWNRPAGGRLWYTMCPPSLAKAWDCCPPGNLSRAASFSTVRKGHLFWVWGAWDVEDRIFRNSKVYSEMKTLSGNEDSWGLRCELF